MCYCRALNNPGNPNPRTGVSGSGICLWYVDGGVIEHCEAAYNGWNMQNPDENGPVGIWLAFWLAGLPNYYQQYATVPLAVGCTLLAAAIGVAAVAVLSRHRPTRRLSYAVWVSFYFTLPLAVLDALYCGWYLDHGWVFVTRYWYLTVFYIVPWMTFVPVAILLNRLENRATMTRS